MLFSSRGAGPKDRRSPAGKSGKYAGEAPDAGPGEAAAGYCAEKPER